MKPTKRDWHTFSIVALLSATQIAKFSYQQYSQKGSMDHSHAYSDPRKTMALPLQVGVVMHAQVCHESKDEPFRLSPELNSVKNNRSWKKSISN